MHAPVPGQHGTSDAGWRQLPKMALTLAAGCLGAALAYGAAMPLPFLLGPLMLTAVATMLGLPVRTLPFGRELGQVVVGVSIGLRFVPDVAIATLRLIPVMFASTLLVIVATSAAAILLEKLAGIDRRTAFFATAAAGLAEMAVIAHQKGADADTVAIVHLIRVTAIVTTVPFLLAIFGETGQVPEKVVNLAAELLPLAALLAGAAVLAYLLLPMRMPNTWLLAPALLGATIACMGYGPFAVPRVLLNIAQIVIGTWIGCRFRREIVGRLPRVTLAAVGTTAFLLAAAALIASLVGHVAGLPFSTGLLAVAPAGVTEMVLTATAMHLDATTVTGFQIMRIALVMTTIPLVFRAFDYCSRFLPNGKS
ncbi:MULTISPECIES: AbrB family transcriptional regulator [unclassified Sinorhizobium]|uniref:AbrB family transcriptional regulator n=1 Tax=unclassified Sinorhizobium TaxID=2613772 RepID=UPI003525908A